MPPNDPPIIFLRIPADGSDMKRFSTTTVNITADKKNSTFQLGHIPWVEDYWKFENAAYAGRVACCFRIERPDTKEQTDTEEQTDTKEKTDARKKTDKVWGIWVLLKSTNPRSKLPLNENEHWKHLENRKARGDAFLCKLGDPPVVGGKANYVNVPKAALDDGCKVFKWPMLVYAKAAYAGNGKCFDENGEWWVEGDTHLLSGQWYVPWQLSFDQLCP